MNRKTTSWLVGVSALLMSAGMSCAETVQLVIEGTLSVSRAYGSTPAIYDGDSFSLTILYDTNATATYSNEAAGIAQWHYGDSYGNPHGGAITSWLFATQAADQESQFLYGGSMTSSSTNSMALHDVEGGLSKFGLASEYASGSEHFKLDFSAIDGDGDALDGFDLGQFIDGSAFDEFIAIFQLSGADYGLHLDLNVSSASFSNIVPIPAPFYLAAAGLIGVMVLRRRLV